MSIKGSSSGLNIKSVFLIFSVATVLATAIRVIQTYTIIEADTGFYSKYNATVWLLYAILIMAGIAIFAVPYLVKKIPQSRLPESKNIPLAVFSVLTAVTLVIDMFDSFEKFSNVFSAYTPTEQQTMASYMMKTGGAPLVLESICAVLSAVYFLILAIKYFGVKLDTVKFKLLAVCPVFWATGRIVQRFTRTISFINVSDLLLELFMLAFLMLFLLNLAQVNSNINSRAVMDKVYSYGLISAMLEIVISVPKVIVAIITPELNSAGNPLELCNIALAVFTVLLLVAMLKIPLNDNITLKQAEKEAKEKQSEE